jgi:hypothetical protein
MDERMELMVIPLFTGEVVGLGTGWIIGPPVGGAGVSASAGEFVLMQCLVRKKIRDRVKCWRGRLTKECAVGMWRWVGGLDSCICN